MMEQLLTIFPVNVNWIVQLYTDMEVTGSKPQLRNRPGASKNYLTWQCRYYSLILITRPLLFILLAYFRLIKMNK